MMMNVRQDTQASDLLDIFIPCNFFFILNFASLVLDNYLFSPRHHVSNCVLEKTLMFLKLEWVLLWEIKKGEILMMEIFLSCY